jgi:cyclopropane fatty-acyl-phospholipid synthase-like methyltransferase
MSRRIALILALALGALVEAQQPQRKPDIHFAPTAPEVVEGMLRLARVTSADVVYDLGSGDGRIVIAAAQNYGARGVGIELDPKLVAEARRDAERAGVSDRVTFIEGDMFEADISEATVVTLYLLEQINERLRPKLTRELRPGARIVSHVFRMGGWRPDEQTVVAGRNVLLWRVPER